ncbi:hypothetical protein KY319_00025 [Candidatus Woesearchaeota archaeon]|nr:hypothetical protein [Candidatus Woesearchaeota archaeon]
MKNKIRYGTTEFKNPDLYKLNKKGFFMADMHFHSNLGEGFLVARQILNVIKNKKMAAAITDHNSIRGAVKLYSQSPEKIIPGTEIISKEGVHCLFYFYNMKELQNFYSKHVENEIDSNYNFYLKTKILDIIDASKNYSCVVCLPHPFSYFSPKFHEMLKEIVKNKKVNAIETINGFLPHMFNRSAADFSLKVKTGITGGTDGRTLQEIGNVVTCAKADTKEEFLDSIRKRKTIVLGTEMNTIGKLRNIIYRPEMHPKNWPASLKRRIKIIIS